MKHFGIYSPTMGLRKDWPSVLLDKSFTPDCENIQYWNGEIRTAKMRRKHLLRQFFAFTESGGDAVITGNELVAIPDGSDVLVFNDATGTVYENTSVAYDGTSTTISASGETISGSYIALYTSGLETDPTDANFLQVPTPDGEAIIHYHSLLSDSNILYLFAFTAEHVYLWSTTTTSWILAFTPSSTVSLWSSASLNGYLIITNNIDVPMVWNGLLEADCFDGLGGSTGETHLGPEIVSGGVRISKAKGVIAFEGHIVFAGYTLSNSSDYPNGIIWSDLDDHTDFIPAAGSDAGATYVEGEGVITGALGIKGDFLYVFKDRSARTFWYTGTDMIFNSRALSVHVGCVCPHSVISDQEGNLYFYASDMTFREVDMGVISHALGDDAKNLVQNLTILSGMCGAFIPEYGEVWWSVPYGATATANTKTFRYKEGKWLPVDMAVSAFGQYRENATYTWDTLPFGSWEEWDWVSWDSTESVAGWPLDLCADYSGLTYLNHASYKDDGEDYTSYFVLTTDLGDLQSLRWYKRMLAIQLFLQTVGNESITVYIKRDDEIDWQEAGTITVDSSDTAAVLVKRIPVDYRAKRFQIKVAATVPIRFLGMEFDFNIAGER